MRSQWEEGGHGRGVALFGWMRDKEKEEKRRKDSKAERDGDRSFVNFTVTNIHSVGVHKTKQ